MSRDPARTRGTPPRRPSHRPPPRNGAWRPQFEVLEDRVLPAASALATAAAVDVNGAVAGVKGQGPLARVGYQLAYLYHEYQAAGGQGGAAALPPAATVEVVGDSVVVD